jgi:hypothetical protein
MLSLKIAAHTSDNPPWFFWQEFRRQAERHWHKRYKINKSGGGWTMSANINFDQNKASHISTGSSGFEIAVIAGIKLLRIARLGSPLGIAGFILPLAFIKNCRLIHFVLAAADRAINRSRPEQQKGV